MINLSIIIASNQITTVEYFVVYHLFASITSVPLEVVEKSTVQNVSRSFLLGTDV